MDAAELVFHQGGKDLLHVRLHQAETCIGSHPTNDVLLPDESLPEVAAVLVDRGAGRFKLRDLSGGLLKINGASSEDDERELTDGDVIEIGGFALRFAMRGGVEPTYRQTMILGEDSKSGSAGVITYDGQKLRVLPDRPFNIGSDEDNDLVIEDDFVSSFHCRITCQNGRWTLVDLASTNGTSVNGLRVREAELPSPASLQIGRAALSFEVEPPPTAQKRDVPLISFAGMIAHGAKMGRIFEHLRKLADSPAPVLITGESGSGKELVARALHDESSRKSGPYLALNCGALAASLIESELFGHVKGAFTGAQAEKKGAFEAAQNGTLFLDEIGELPLDLQPKLLRVLESQVVRRVGGTVELPVNARVVAATHRNLKERVQLGLFREDLFHRLYVLTLQIPPLRERREDIVPLARHFLATQAADRPLEFDVEAERALEAYRWPGNVRELRNVVLRACLTTEGNVIRTSDLQFSGEAFEAEQRDARRTVRRADQAERQRMLDALEAAGDNRAEAARLLGLSKSTFHDRLRRLGLPPKSKKAP